MKIILSLLLAVSLGLCGCADITNWAQSPAGQAVINAALADALQIVTGLLLAGGPQSMVSLRERGIAQMMASHPNMSYSVASVYIDEAIKIKTHVVVIQ